MKNLLGLDVAAIANNPAFTLGMGILGNNTGHYGEAGPAYAGGLKDFYRQQSLVQENERRKKQMEIQNAQLAMQQQQNARQVAQFGQQQEQAKKLQAWVNADPARQKQYGGLPNSMIMEKWKQSNKTQALPSGMRMGANGNPEMIPAWEQFQLKKSQASAPNSTTIIGGKQQSKEAETVGKYYGGEFTKIQDAGRAARRNNSELARLGQLYDKAYTGTGGEQYQAIAKAANILGADINGVPEAEAAAALSNQLALQLRSPAGGAGMPGALSDKDREFLMSMVPGLATTPEGRRLMLETRKKLNERSIVVAKMARDYRMKHRQMDEGFFSMLDEWSAQNPLFADISAPQQSTGGTWGKVRRKQ